MAKELALRDAPFGAPVAAKDAPEMLLRTKGVARSHASPTGAS